MYLKQLTIDGPLWFIPYPRRILSVVGAPVPYPSDIVDPQNPTTAEIEAYHEAYCTALTDLFDSHKESEQQELIID